MMQKWSPFIEAIRSSPKFTDAASTDAKWADALNDIERGLEFFSRVDDARAIDLFDRLSGVIDDEGSTVKQRLLRIVAALSEFLHGRHKVN